MRRRLLHQRPLPDYVNHAQHWAGSVRHGAGRQCAADCSAPALPLLLASPRITLAQHPATHALQYNKGLAFSQKERDRLYLRGLLPPAVLSQEVQTERVLTNIRK